MGSIDSVAYHSPQYAVFIYQNAQFLYQPFVVYQHLFCVSLHLGFCDFSINCTQGSLQRLNQTANLGFIAMRRKSDCLEHSWTCFCVLQYCHNMLKSKKFLPFLRQCAEICPLRDCFGRIRLNPSPGQTFFLRLAFPRLTNHRSAHP